MLSVSRRSFLGGLLGVLASWMGGKAAEQRMPTQPRVAAIPYTLPCVTNYYYDLVEPSTDSLTCVTEYVP